MNAQYRPGANPAYVDSRALVVSTAERTSELAGLAGSEVSVLGVIDVLSRGVLTDLPDFAIVLPEDNDLRIVIRGALDVTVGKQSWSGGGVATWTEHVISDGAGAEVLVSAAGASADAADLPIAGGVVLVDVVRWHASPESPVANETSSEPIAESSPSGEQGDEPKAASVAGEEPEAAADAEPAAEAIEDEPAAESAPEVVPAAEPKGEAAAESEPASEPEPEPAAESPSDAAEPLPEAPRDPHHTVYEVDEDFDAKHGATVAGRRPSGAGPVLAPPAAGSDSGAGPAASAPGSAIAPSDLGDHDGHTVAASDLRKLRRQASPPPRSSGQHATLVLSTGRTVEVAQPVLIGRAPRVGQSSGHDMPSLVVVDDPYVSGTHLEVRFQDSSLVAIDRSTNGTLLTRPGRDPERLTKDLPTVLTGGSVLALSDDLTVSVDVKAGS